MMNIGDKRFNDEEYYKKEIEDFLLNKFNNNKVICRILAWIFLNENYYKEFLRKSGSIKYETANNRIAGIMSKDFVTGLRNEFQDQEGKETIAGIVNKIVNKIEASIQNNNNNNYIKLLGEFCPRENKNLLKSSNTDIAASKKYSSCMIFYGPPGTGKTRKAKEIAAELTGVRVEDVDGEIEKPAGRIKLVQFHPSYSYYDFVEGIIADKNGFELKDKVFKEFANRAADSIENNYVLLIDEINRANMASVFGELLYALEYRGKEINTSGGTLV